MRQRVPALIKASREHRLLVARHGLTFAWWSVTSDGWLLEEICSYPRGRGHGTAMLRKFLGLANVADVPVTLLCSPERLNWYRRHGFRLTPPQAHITRLGLVSMRRTRRPDRSPRRRYPTTSVKTDNALRTASTQNRHRERNHRH